jgi:hypothetical protein
LFLSSNGMRQIMADFRASIVHKQMDQPLARIKAI